MQPRQLIDLTNPGHQCAPIPLVSEFGTSVNGVWTQREALAATHLRVLVFVCPGCSKTFDIAISQPQGADDGFAS